MIKNQKRENEVELGGIRELPPNPFLPWEIGLKPNNNLKEASHKNTIKPEEENLPTSLISISQTKS